MSKQLADIKNAFPCRDNIIDQLYVLLNHHHLPLILLTGPHGSGKTSITKTVLNSIDCLFSWTNCHELMSAHQFQEKVIIDFSDYLDQDQNSAKCTSNDDFVLKMIQTIHDLNNELNLKSVSKISPLPSTKGRGSARKRQKANDQEEKQIKGFIILDNCDQFLDKLATTLPLVININKMLDRLNPLTIILITSWSYDLLIPYISAIPKPYLIEFDCYSNDQLFQILTFSKPKGYSTDYESFVKMMIDNTSHSTHNLNHLRFICESNFEKFLKPVNGKKIDSLSLWKAFSSNLDDCVEKVALKLEKHFSSANLDIPISVKYLLLSAFIASYNPVSSDRKYFLISSDNKKNHSNRTRHEKGSMNPKAFTLERLLHIYESIIHLNHPFSEELNLKYPIKDLLAQIETLVSLKLLIRINSATISPLMSLSKYIISDSLTFQSLNSIAKSLDIELKKYLECYN